MVHDIEVGRDNPDGADQGFIRGYFPDLLDKPIFHSPPNGTKLAGQCRLPLGCQILLLSQTPVEYVPCGPNSVITFSGASWLKLWYWWSWPVLPLGAQWHERRRQTIGYDEEMPLVLIQAVFNLGIIAVTRIARPSMSKLCQKREVMSAFLIQAGLKAVSIISIIAAYIIPIFLIATTVHPLVGLSMYLLATFALSCIAVNALLLPMLPVLVPWIAIIGTLLVMAYPWYNDGVVRALVVFGCGFCCSPFIWVTFVKVMSCVLHVSLEKGEGYSAKLAPESIPTSELSKFMCT